VWEGEGRGENRSSTILYARRNGRGKGGVKERKWANTRSIRILWRKEAVMIANFLINKKEKK